MLELKRDQLQRVAARGVEIANDEYQGEVEHLALKRICIDIEDALAGSLNETAIESLEDSIETFRSKLAQVKAGRFPPLAEVS